MATQIDLAGLPMEVLGLVLEQLFDRVTVRAEKPTQLSRFNQIVKEDPQLSIFQVLNGDRHHLVKRKLLKLAFFEFYYPCNPAATFSTFFKYLDHIHKLSVNYSDLYISVPEPKTPYQYTNSKSKSFIPFQTAEMYTRRESLRVLKIKRTLLLKRHFRTRLAAGLVSGSLICGRLRRSINAALTAAATASRDGAGDFMNLEKKTISERFDVILELSFEGYWKNLALDITVSICKGRIITLTSPFGEDVPDVTAELNAWFNSTKSGLKLVA